MHEFGELTLIVPRRAAPSLRLYPSRFARLELKKRPMEEWESIKSNRGRGKERPSFAEMVEALRK
jgi:hypothetical protein